MADQLSSIQTHLWIISILLVGVFLLNVFCYFLRSGEDRAYRKLKALADSERYEELLALTSSNLRKLPASQHDLLYQAMALICLGRFPEARRVAEKFKTVAPSMYSEATNMLAIIDEKSSIES